MVIFIYGLDSYQSWKKTGEIIQQYKKIHPRGLNFLNFDFKEDNFENFRRSLEATSIFKEKKLILIKNLFLGGNSIKLFSEYIDSSKIFKSNENVVLIYEADDFSKNKKESLSKEKTDLFKKLIKFSKSQKFELLDERGTRSWVVKEFSKKGIKISREALEKLISWVGNDLWRMENEISKLSLLGVTLIQEKDVNALLRPKLEINIFKIVDAVSSKNKKLALKMVQEYQDQGESVEYLFSMILWQMRNIVQVKFSKFNIENPDFKRKENIARELKIHPYVAEKSIILAKKFGKEEIKKVYQKLLEVDYKIKTGKIDSKTALILFVSEIC